MAAGYEWAHTEMKLPNHDRALIDMGKLTTYSLNPNHEYGRHKARVFEAALGLTLKDVDLLYDAIVEAVETEEAQLGLLDESGQRYRVDFEMTGPNGKTAMVRSAWNIRPNEDFPRLVSVFVI